MCKYIVSIRTGKILDTIIDDIPISKDEAIVTVEPFDGIYDPVYDFKNKVFVENKPIEEIGNIKKQQALEQELNDIQQWFNSTDYICFKVLRGNWLKTDYRYKQYLMDYEVKNTRANEIKTTLTE